MLMALKADQPPSGQSDFTVISLKRERSGKATKRFKEMHGCQLKKLTPLPLRSFATGPAAKSRQQSCQTFLMDILKDVKIAYYIKEYIQSTNLNQYQRKLYLQQQLFLLSHVKNHFCQ